MNLLENIEESETRHQLKGKGWQKPSSMHSFEIMLAESNNLCRHLMEKWISFLPEPFNNITVVCQNGSKSLGQITQKANMFMFCQTWLGHHILTKYMFYDVGFKAFVEEHAAVSL